MTQPKTTIEKLAEKYYKRTSSNPDQSFWNWIDSTGIEANEKEFIKLLKEFDNYFIKL